MKFLSIILFLFFILQIPKLLATEIIGGIGYQNYNNDDSNFSTLSPSVEVYVPVYKNFSAGLALSYAKINYGMKHDLANNVGLSNLGLSGSASAGSVPLQIALRYDYELSRNFKLTGIIKAGLSAGSSNYYNATTRSCEDGEDCNSPNAVIVSSHTDNLEVLADKVVGFDLGLIYKQYGFFVYYSAMNVINTYTDSDAQALNTSDPLIKINQTNHKNTMQAVGFKLSYLFDF